MGKHAPDMHRANPDIGRMQRLHAKNNAMKREKARMPSTQPLKILLLVIFIIYMIAMWMIV